MFFHKAVNDQYFVPLFYYSLNKYHCNISYMYELKFFLYLEYERR